MHIIIFTICYHFISIFCLSYVDIFIYFVSLIVVLALTRFRSQKRAKNI